MTMRELLVEVAATYDRAEGCKEHVLGQQVLRSVSRRTTLGGPEGWRIRGYGGNGYAAICPWIGIYDTTINVDPKKGLYLTYIFSEDLKTVTLTLQQGVTEISDR